MHKARELDAIPPLEPTLAQALERWLVTSGSGPPAFLRAMQGGQSTCFVLATASERLVLKVYRSESHDRESVAAEYAALEKVWLCSSGYACVTVPRPVALFEGQGAVLMSFVEGSDLDVFMGRGFLRSKSLDDLAGSILSGLHLYHDALGGPFGDCYPGNFLVQSAGLVGMLDPHLPELSGSPADEPLVCMSVDLGYWAAAVALAMPAELRKHGRLPLNRLRLTWKLIERVAQEFEPEQRRAFVRGIYASAAERASLWVAGRTIAVRTKRALTNGTLRFMEARQPLPIRSNG